MVEKDPQKEVEKTEDKGNVQVDQKQERMWAMFAHLSALANLIVWLPGVNIIGPLVIWLVKKNEMPLVEKEGKEALNFQISMAIYGAVAFILCFIVIGMALLPLIALANLILVIMASVKVSNGETFTYPCTIRLIK